MFESREVVHTSDDYGTSTDDLKFQDITAAAFSSRCAALPLDTLHTTPLYSLLAEQSTAFVLSFTCLCILLPLLLSFSFYLSALLKSQSTQLRDPYSRANIFEIKF